MLVREGADQEDADEYRLVLHREAYAEEKRHRNAENDQVR